MIEEGCPSPLGAHAERDGVNFAIFSAAAERVELCLFDDRGTEASRVDLPGMSDGVWHGFLPGMASGQRYGYRMHGRYAPGDGHRLNAAKLLIDPYARALSGKFRWSPAVFDYLDDLDDGRINTADSAPFVPKSVVTDATAPSLQPAPDIAWADMIIYEANVRGYTMRRADLSDQERGRFAGMTNGNVLDYLKSLGITSIELMPVFEFIDEHFLHERGLRNFWGYNTISFFAPAARYAMGDPRQEFRDMLNAMHDAGFEVILDVAYNHTGESDAAGPNISFRGIDNLTYYRTEAGDQGRYVNDTGTGNTINMDHPRVRQLIIDSLRYWTADMGVDGFRFDLATVQGRTADGFAPDHAFFNELSDDPVLKASKLIAEPWDPGPGGYQLGRFPKNWAEWNDRYRDSVRRFWRGDGGETAEFARRLHGSSDVFEAGGRSPAASVNFISAHDGFTLADLVSFESRHNEANGEMNRDGHSHNYSRNYGQEGDTDDPAINSLRRQQRLNMLATLLLSQGTPMLLAGDEFGNSQAGNNNAYAQDNETGWIDWTGLDTDPEFPGAIRALISLRKDTPLLRQSDYVHGTSVDAGGWADIQWLAADGRPMDESHWNATQALSLVLTGARESQSNYRTAVAVLINGSETPVELTLPDAGAGRDWQIRFASAARDFRPLGKNRWQIPAAALVCLVTDAVAVEVSPQPAP